MRPRWRRRGAFKPAARGPARRRAAGGYNSPLQPARRAGCRGRAVASADGVPGRPLPRRPPRPASELPVSPQLLPDHAQALLALADGTVFHGHLDRRRRPHRRRGGVQHRADRLSGNPDRSELLPADRHADLSAHRQLRRQCRRRRGDARCIAAGLVVKDLPLRASNFRSDADARATTCGAKARSAIAGIDTRRLTRAPAHAGRAERLHRRACRWARRSTPAHDRRARSRRRGRRRAWRASTWRRSCQRARALRVDRDEWALGRGYGTLDGAALPRRRLRLRRQAQHPAHARRARLPGHGGAGADAGGRGAGAASPTASSWPTARAIPSPATTRSRRRAS